jgi:hypothetical protein
MKAKLTEALNITYELTSDIEGRYPIGLVRIRYLLEQVLDGLSVAHDEEAVHLGEEPPPSAA